MKKFLMIIFFLLVICPVSKSKICENLTKSDCKTDESKYPDFCCYFEQIIPPPTDENDGFCKTVPFSSFFKGYKREYINDILFIIINIINKRINIILNNFIF